MTLAEQILSQLGKVDIALQQRLSAMSNQELTNALDDDLIWNEMLREVGLIKWLQTYSSNYDRLFNNQIEKIGFRLVDSISADIDIIKSNMDLLKASNNRTIVGYQTQASENVRAKLMNSFLDGTTSKETVRLIAEQNPFSTAQAGTIVNTAYADFQRSTTAQIFKDKPEQRFKYGDALIPTSSCQCRDLVLNQREEGYTMAEIKKGIQTSCTDSKGKVLKIYWEGRRPNFNCIHEWLPIN